MNDCPVKDDGEDTEEKLEDKSKNNKVRQNHAAFASDDTDEIAFANSIRGSDALRATVKSERLELEREKMRLEAEERKRDREERAKVREQERAERKADREAHSELELKKFELMLETLSSVNK